MKALVAGWFSFEGMGATAGDVMVRDVVCGWLGEAGVPFDVALAAPFAGGVDWRAVPPSSYSHVVFVCGPFGNGPPVDEMLARFAASTLIGLDLTMLEPLEVWNPFRLLLERDSSRTTRPDFSMLSEQPRVPVVGLILIHAQPEYGARDLHREANAAVEGLAARREVAVVRIDTRLDVNQTGLRSEREVESLIARMDAVLTTRLHGLVLSLKNGVPVVAVDPVAGGGKIRKQGEALDWPWVFASDRLDQSVLERAFDACLAPAGRERAAASRRAALDRLAEVRPRFVDALRPRAEM
jgi:hypothetical protein